MSNALEIDSATSSSGEKSRASPAATIGDTETEANGAWSSRGVKKPASRIEAGQSCISLFGSMTRTGGKLPPATSKSPLVSRLSCSLHDGSERQYSFGIESTWPLNSTNGRRRLVAEHRSNAEPIDEQVLQFHILIDVGRSITKCIRNTVVVNVVDRLVDTCQSHDVVTTED